MASKTNTIDFVEFPAKSVAEIGSAKAFYSEVFGWAFRDWGDDYIDTQSAGVGTGFNADSSHRPAKPLVVIYAADLDAALAKVTEAGGEVTREIFAFPGGRRFHFRDPLGNELAVWSNRE
jgi:predicted enzyme related to lactoylglutathione lyase